MNGNTKTVDKATTIKQTVLQLKEFRGGNMDDANAESGKRYVTAFARANGWLKGFVQTDTNKVLEVDTKVVKGLQGGEFTNVIVKYQVEVEIKKKEEAVK